MLTTCAYLPLLESLFNFCLTHVRDMLMSGVSSITRKRRKLWFLEKILRLSHVVLFILITINLSSLLNGSISVSLLRLINCFHVRPKCLSLFYRSTNTVLNIVRKPSEEVMMRILYSVCVPILTFACDVKVFSSKK